MAETETDAYLVALDRIESAVHSVQSISDYTRDEMKKAHADVSEAIVKLREAHTVKEKE